MILGTSPPTTITLNIPLVSGYMKGRGVGGVDLWTLGPYRGKQEAREPDAGCAGRMGRILRPRCARATTGRVRAIPAPWSTEILAASPSGDVLDVGCGTGISTRLFIAAGANVLGVEVDARMAELARQGGLAGGGGAVRGLGPGGTDVRRSGGGTGLALGRCGRRRGQGGGRAPAGRPRRALLERLSAFARGGAGFR